jgi:nucleotide-binding universal stress UspA family protein
MKQILVATDFSASAGNAFEYALGMAKVLEMEVCAIHAIGPTEGINNNTYNAIFIDDYYNNKRQALKEWADKYTSKEEYKDVEVSTVCGVGFLKNVLDKYISEHYVELLLMGITGSTNISGIVGSNVSTILSVIKTPTLIIPNESKFSSQPLITLATDYETRLSAQDMNALNEMVSAFRSEKLQVLYVTDKKETKHIETEEKKLKELLKTSEPDFKYITSGKTLNSIIDFINNNETDILCLVKHHHNVIYRLFNRSMVNQVINKSVKAVLVLHE